jgi:hypothetical protein
MIRVSNEVENLVSSKLFFKYATTFLFHSTHVFVNNMVILSSNRILMNKPKDDNVNSISETSTCPLCKSDYAIITDSKSGLQTQDRQPTQLLEKELNNRLELNN